MRDRSRLAALATVGVTYPEVGATQDQDLPDGYGHVDRSASVESFVRAVDGLFRFDMHRGAGLSVTASAPVAAEGVVVIMRLFGLVIPCRVVYTIDEPGRRGWAYGTLPGHPEAGEEAFVVETGDAGVARVRIRAFSRPATLLARAGGPLTRLTQRHVTTRYLEALARIR